MAGENVFTIKVEDGGGGDRGGRGGGGSGPSPYPPPASRTPPPDRMPSERPAVMSYQPPIEDITRMLRTPDALKGAATAAGAGAQVAGMVAPMLGSLGPAAMAAAAGLSIVGTVAEKMSDTVAMFVQRGAELSRYSGPLSEARAISQARNIQADIREAQDLGPSLANLTDAQDRASVELRELMLPIKKVIVEWLVDFMEGLNIILGRIQEYSEIIMTLVTGISVMFNDAFGPGKFADIPKHLEAIGITINQIQKDAEEARKKKNQKEEVNALGQLFDLANQEGFAAFAPKNRDLGQWINQPGFGLGGGI